SSGSSAAPSESPGNRNPCRSPGTSPDIPRDSDHTDRHRRPSPHPDTRPLRLRASRRPHQPPLRCPPSARIAGLASPPACSFAPRAGRRSASSTLAAIRWLALDESAELHPDVLRDHRPERFANVLQESRVLSDESPTDFGGEVDVAFLLDQAEHLRAIENVEQFLELGV